MPKERMSDSFSKEIANVRALLQSIDARFAAADVPRADIEEIKGAVDDMRLRIWASMTAASSDDPGVLVRFRVRRAVDICRGVLGDLRAGKVEADLPELAQLGGLARELQAAIPAGS